MPNRILNENIKRDDRIDKLSWFEEIVYYRLIVTADDYGCYDGRAVVLKNDLFPTREDVKKNAVDAAIRKLAAVNLINIYEVDGRPYVYFPMWDKQQRIRNKHRKYPPPSDGHLTADCCQMTADCRSESESESNPNPNPKREYARNARFTPPDVDEVADFVRENGLTNVDPRRFVDFYASKGWLVGKSPMKDWRAACRGWQRRGMAETNGRNAPANPALNYDQRDYSQMDTDGMFIDLEREYGGQQTP